MKKIILMSLISLILILNFATYKEINSIQVKASEIQRHKGLAFGETTIYNNIEYTDKNHSITSYLLVADTYGEELTKEIKLSTYKNIFGITKYTASLID